MRRSLFCCWLALLIMLVGLWIYPIRYTLTRSCILGLFTAVFVLTFLLTYRSRVLRWTLVFVPAVLGASILFWPGQPINQARRQSSYLSALRGYDGVRYVWGGENHWGIDCSGLPRAALIQADFCTGCRTLNPALFRQAAWLWWFDAGAHELASGYRGRVTLLGQSPNLHDFSHAPLSDLHPGDMAIINGDSHVLVYLGNNGNADAPEWIESDTLTMRVRTWGPDYDKSALPWWWNTPAKLARWKGM
ncbi:MAG: NlpC/P60 family protein [Phycisphaerae bacterium]